MNETTHASELRYLDADDLDDSTVEFDDLDVQGQNGENLGELDGFLVEHGAGTVRYLVVDSGGWFRSRRFLIPAEHVTIDREAKVIRADASRASFIDHPEFDEERFGRFSDEEYHAYQRRLGAAWPTARSPETETTTYRQPDWWSSSAYRPERLKPIESRSFVNRSGPATAAGIAGAAAVSARDERHSHQDVTHTHPGGHDHHTHDERELVTARDRDDVSPHFGGRAQPGDILGIETGGETTNIGDSAEDENKRRRAAEKSDRKA